MNTAGADRVRARLLAAVLASAGGWLWTLVPAAAADAPASTATAATLRDETVRRAIDALVAELHRRKDPRRFWEPGEYDGKFESRQKGGWTALAVLALMHAGLSYQDEKLRDAVEYLDRVSIEGTYGVAVRAHVWAMLPDRFRPQLERDVKWLTDAFVEKRGGWYYEQKPPPNQIDNSNAQYGALGLWEAAKRHVAVQRRYWQLMEDRFVQNQRSDGGWNYMTDGVTTGSMTAAGLTVLFITQDFLHAGDFLDLRRQQLLPYAQAIDRGLKWLEQNFSTDANPGKDSHFFYYLYGVERVGLASGYKFFGGRDWYRDGAAAIINRLCVVDATTGVVSIKPSIVAKASTGDGPVADLSFALMFLCRGRVPVAINKLRDTELEWNNRPRDVANLTSWIRDRTETALNWQVVDASLAPEQWLDAPLLYLASDEPLPWLKGVNIEVKKLARDARAWRQQQATGKTPASEPLAGVPSVPQLDRLKRYLDLGGLLLAVNEGTTRRFAESIEKAGQIMYPLLEWRSLPEDHWAYTMLFPIEGKRPQLRGLSNGVRELIILWPAGDLPRSLQTREEPRDTHDKDPGEASLAVAGNIYLYASERNQPRPRLAEHVVQAPAPTGASGRLTLARAIYDGSWNTEPLSLPIFASALKSRRDLSLSIVDHSLAHVHEMQPRPALVIVSGIEKREFTADELAAIKAHVSAGGVVLFETPGGRGEFAAAAEDTMTKLFNAQAAPLTHSRIVTGEGLTDAAKLNRIEYRAYSQEHLGSRETAPRLRGITIDGQPRILLSRDDISHGLLDQPRWGISGYSPQSARDLLGNIIQHAAALAQP